MNRLLLFALCLCCLACDRTETADRRVLAMWHFWSEPAQRSIIDSLINEFERYHSGIDVQLTEVQWSDGKAKLMAAFNAGVAPDVIHLGLDWFTDFDANGVFAALPDSLATDGRASRWVVNSRALVTNDAATTSAVGFCATDAHNVVKRMLPLIWQYGAPSFYTSLPIQASMNDTLVDALWSMRSTLGNQAFIDRSRQLDERLLGGQIRSVYTGSWIADMAKARSIHALRVTPTRSILNADVLAISARSAARRDAEMLIGFLTSYEQARRLCVAVSDAGFPADLVRAAADTAFTMDALRFGFLQTAQMSVTLPAGPAMLAVEPVIEDMIVRCYDAPNRETVRSIVQAAASEVARLSSR
jgi:hypothetical protein